jgi:hypothetical protein
MNEFKESIDYVKALLKPGLKGKNISDAELLWRMFLSFSNHFTWDEKEQPEDKAAKALEEEMKPIMDIESTYLQSKIMWYRMSRFKYAHMMIKTTMDPFEYDNIFVKPFRSWINYEKQEHEAKTIAFNKPQLHGRYKCDIKFKFQ